MRREKKKTAVCEREKWLEKLEIAEFLSAWRDVDIYVYPFVVIVLCYIIIAPLDSHKEGNQANHSFLPRNIV
jgi:hypothetical protein